MVQFLYCTIFLVVWNGYLTCKTHAYETAVTFLGHPKAQLCFPLQNYIKSLRPAKLLGNTSALCSTKLHPSKSYILTSYKLNWLDIHPHTCMHSIEITSSLHFTMSKLSNHRPFILILTIGSSLAPYFFYVYFLEVCDTWIISQLCYAKVCFLCVDHYYNRN